MRVAVHLYLSCGWSITIACMLFRLLVVLVGVSLQAADWPSFRGNNAAGVSSSSAPEILSVEHNLVWKKDLPKTASSPILAGGRVIANLFDEEALALIALDADSGEELWRVEPPRSRKEAFNPHHGPESPSPAFDGEHLYAFFPDFGLISYALDGKERGRVPLGPFSSVQGIGTSPVVAEGKVVLLVDQATGAYIAAFDSATGEQEWRHERPTNFLGGIRRR